MADITDEGVSCKNLRIDFFYILSFFLPQDKSFLPYMSFIFAAAICIQFTLDTKSLLSLYVLIYCILNC